MQDVKPRKNRTPFNPSDWIGKKFGHWTVLNYVGMAGTMRLLKCRCKCGMVRKVTAANLQDGRSTQCWECGRKQCGNRQRKAFYGANLFRLIWKKSAARYTLCEEWKDPAKFIAWMKDNHISHTTLIALDPAKPLGPDNVWMERGGAGFRVKKLYRIAGREQTAAEWEAEIGVSRERVRQMALRYAGKCIKCQRNSAGHAFCLRCQDIASKNYTGTNIHIRAARMIAEIEDQERPDGVPFGA